MLFNLIEQALDEANISLRTEFYTFPIRIIALRLTLFLKRQVIMSRRIRNQ